MGIVVNRSSSVARQSPTENFGWQAGLDGTSTSQGQELGWGTAILWHRDILLRLTLFRYGIVEGLVDGVSISCTSIYIGI